ncbi:hypothetical protein GMORB2_2898 [Geosmithia morbida]|uniref:DNase1 protein n=1 Tax=Geosmithia morbida TaxID=1094350 RepID=A0A9P4YR00_9HYPO|nr:uncharacterized protein GMORB2_2898 [Geosmithia morbida]KAF4120460.1 hypothetical protein GMORB2_2898 [Geosmithia morbida]
MFFSKALLALAGSVALASANQVTFWTLDNVTRTVYFTSNENSFPVDSVTVDGSENKTVSLPDNFVGNFYAVQQGKQNVPGMLGEVRFSGEFGLTYFDVSAIVDPNDKDNVKQMFPASSQSPTSGCEVFPCNNAYYLPDDVQTKSTDENHLITTLGTGSVGL